MPADKWSQFAQPATGGADKWASFAQGTPDPTSLPSLPVDTRNSIQKTFDANVQTNPADSLLGTGLKSATAAVGAPLIHPINSIEGLLQMIRHPIDSAHQDVNQLYADKAAGGLGYAAAKLGGSLAGNALLSELGGSAIKGVAGKIAGEPIVAGENFTPTQLKAHTGILGRMNGLGDNFIPQDASASTLSTIRQAAADNPSIADVATGKGSTPQNIAAFQAILQKANSSLEAPHAATIAQHANLPADVTGVQAAVGNSFPKTLAGVSPEDAAAIQELQGRLGTVKTLGGLNDLRQWLNNEAAAGYKQDGIAANRGTATKAGIRSAADAARNAYYDQLQQASGTDFRPIKAQQSALLDQQEGAAKLGQTLSAQQAVADEPKSTQQVLADALTGGRALKAGPIAGATQLIAEKALGRTPLTQPNYLIRQMLGKLPEPTPAPAGIARFLTNSNLSLGSGQ